MGGAVTGRDTFVGIPLVDAQKVPPARVAGTDVGTPTADLYRRVSFGDGGQAVLPTEGEALTTIEHRGNAAIETYGGDTVKVSLEKSNHFTSE